MQDKVSAGVRVNHARHLKIQAFRWTQLRRAVHTVTRSIIFFLYNFYTHLLPLYTVYTTQTLCFHYVNFPMGGCMDLVYIALILAFGVAMWGLIEGLGKLGGRS